MKPRPQRDHLTPAEEQLLDAVTTPIPDLTDMTYADLTALESALAAAPVRDEDAIREAFVEKIRRCIALAERTPATPHIPHDDPYWDAPRRPDCYYPEPLCYLLPDQCCRCKAAPSEPA